jgi:hypothetical protein
MHYHLGYCRNDEQIKGKINYYANRGIEQNVKDNYSNWEQGKPTNSTHPNGTTATKFLGRLPKFIDKKNFPDNIFIDIGEGTTKVENNISMLPSPLK